MINQAVNTHSEEKTCALPRTDVGLRCVLDLRYSMNRVESRVSQRVGQLPVVKRSVDNLTDMRVRQGREYWNQNLDVEFNVQQRFPASCHTVRAIAASACSASALTCVCPRRGDVREGGCVMYHICRVRF